MGVFEMVVAIVFIATLGKVAVARARGHGESASEDRVRALEAALHANEARLGQTEARLEELGEKLVFVENLLTPPDPATQLPRTTK
jgi:hypothetical protein